MPIDVNWIWGFVLICLSISLLVFALAVVRSLMNHGESEMAYRDGFIGFYPWPRVWADKDTHAFAESLPRDSYGRLTRELTEDEQKVFSADVVDIDKTNFRLKLSADGLIIYQNKLIEKDIIEATKRVEGLTPEQRIVTNDMYFASLSAYEHYLPALNIFFLIFESELHSNGRNSTIFFMTPIRKKDLLRIKEKRANSKPSSLTNFGPYTEQQRQRFTGAISLNANLSGHYAPSLVPAFKTAALIFEKALNESQLWNFLEQYSQAWTSYQSEMYNSSLSVCWSLIERDLFEQTRDLLNSLQTGQVKELDDQNTPQLMRPRQENRLRAKINNGDSPMAGRMINILQANGVTLHTSLDSVKTARNNFQHSGVNISRTENKDALLICRSICSSNFGIELNCNLHPNSHLGVTI